jgi:hypothetical protein
MPEYRIEWSIEVEAESPEAAARLALAIQKDADRSLGSAFMVWGEDPDEPDIIDLAAIDDEPAVEHQAVSSMKEP